MQISLNWLKTYIDLDGLSIEEICRHLTDLGLEVETVESKSPIEGDVVVGKILEASPHPDAEKLRLTKVITAEKEEPLAIVCGAPNAREGIYVAVAKVGSRIGDLKIKKSKIRGEKSFGMLCSGAELKISGDDDGIMELDASLALGASIADIFSLKDTIITLGLTPNRPDCLGILGIARDLGAKLGRPLIMPPHDVATKAATSSGSKIEIAIENDEDCGRFVGLYIEGVKTIPSPLWMQHRLEACGMRPINLIVDVTNYVMLEYGQPNHAYDVRDISGGKISVRRASSGEKLTTLDEKEHVLDDMDLLICDEKGPVGLAGIMGGANSEVKDDTTAIIVEVAHFSPRLVRKTSKKTQLHTEASHRFERGTDITVLKDVAYRIGYLLSKGMESQGESLPLVYETAVDVYPKKFKPSRIAVRLQRLKRLLGLHSVTTGDCQRVLENLGFTFLDKKDDRMVFEVPSFRRDIEREVDLIEEFCRVNGYDKLPVSLPMMEIKPLQEDPFVGFLDTLKEAIAATGFHEIISFPFVSQKDLEALLLEKGHPLLRKVVLKNPLNEDQAFLQTSLMVNLLKAVSKNRRFGDIGGHLFEVARCFFQKEDVKEEGYHSHTQEQGRHLFGRAREDKRPIERTYACGILDNPQCQKSWDREHRDLDFFDGKGAIEEILESFGINDLSYTAEGLENLPWLNKKAAAIIKQGDSMLGYVGEVHPKTAHDFQLDFKKAPIVFELELDTVFRLTSKQKQFETITTQYPALTRDLAFVVPEGTTAKDFQEALASFRRRNLKSARLFDLYSGKGVPEGKKSMAYALTFQSAKKTLTDKEVEKEIDLLKGWLEEKVQATLR